MDDLNGGAGEGRFPWGSLVSRFLHPAQVAVIEAMLWVDLPLSPSDLRSMFGGDYSNSHVAYHARALVERGILKLVDTEQVRGATRHIYVIAAESEWL
jgi:hypothetical protein